ncbi:uncharacterized protein [Anomalospiza imberbis]|uniref:uncharacterized protein n=1 Tax=Anomalospiza imberbis TaxID=187417 RepID=UPI00358F0572
MNPGTQLGSSGASIPVGEHGLSLSVPNSGWFCHLRVLKEFQIPFPPAPSPASCSLRAVICLLGGTSLRVVALPWLLWGWWHCCGSVCPSPGLVALLWLCVSIPRVGGTAVALCAHPRGWWHCHGCSGVGGTAVALCAHPQGWWHCHGCSGVGGTAVALCVHPRGWWHCRGSVCPSPGLVALPWLCVPIPGVGGSVCPSPGLVALPWLCVSIPRVGGTAVALCVHPQGWWHCRGSVCPSPGSVALCAHPRGWWHCRGSVCPSPGSVALCAHPWCWWHCRGCSGVGGTAVVPAACPQCHRSAAISCCTIRTGDNSASRPSASRVASPFHTFLWSLQTPHLSPPGCFDSCSQPLHGHPSPAFPTFGGLLSC